MGFSRRMRSRRVKLTEMRHRYVLSVVLTVLMRMILIEISGDKVYRLLSQLDITSAREVFEVLWRICHPEGVADEDWMDGQ